MGVLTRVGRGKFSLIPGKTFRPAVDKKLKTINSKLKNEFPFLKTCLWNTSVFNEFMVHQPGRFFILVEVEKDATESVFFCLKDAKYALFINPDQKLIERYATDESETLVIRSLVTESPLQEVEGIYTVTIEKMLVDIYCDDVVFAAQQGSEMRTIFQEAIGNYIVSENRLIRYADRRGKKESFIDYLRSIQNLRQ